MFWYAVDKIKSALDDDADVLILCSPALLEATVREIPAATVRESTKLGSALFAVKNSILARGRNKLVTFTPHPLPFIPNQTVAFYDEYPFAGWIGAIKRILFTIGALTSRCRVGIINRSLAIPFLRKCGIPTKRIFFDGALPHIDTSKVPRRSAHPGSPPRIGLVGTDSRKKNYPLIFSKLRELGLDNAVSFMVYGKENDYTKELERDFPSIKFQIIDSDYRDILSFFSSVDYLISASTAEGYGRPMGLAARLRVPMFLLKSPVFMEFFSNHAVFFNNIRDMLIYIVNEKPSSLSDAPSLSEDCPSRSAYFA